MFAGMKDAGLGSKAKRWSVTATGGAAALAVVLAGCSAQNDSADEAVQDFTVVASGPIDSLPGEVTIAASGDIACPPSDDLRLGADARHETAQQFGIQVDEQALEELEVLEAEERVEGNADPTPDDYNKGEGSGEGEKSKCRQKFTAAAIKAKLDDSSYDKVLTLGDHQYETADLHAMETVYAPTWGQFKDDTYPVKGNHDNTGYYQWWNGMDADGDPKDDGPAGTSKTGYYAIETGDSATSGWHIVVLNSNCYVGKDCGDQQLAWLKKELETTKKPCVAAAWHKPVFRSDKKGVEEPVEEPRFLPFWQELADAKADLVLNGHKHYYARLNPMDRDGKVVEEGNGIREIISGVGGAGFYTFHEPENAEGEEVPAPRDAFHNRDTFGPLEVSFKANSYDWNFAPAAGVPGNGKATDSGKAECRAK
jgi:hypothetical protein